MEFNTNEKHWSFRKNYRWNREVLGYSRTRSAYSALYDTRLGIFLFG